MVFSFVDVSVLARCIRFVLKEILFELLCSFMMLLDTMWSHQIAVPYIRMYIRPIEGHAHIKYIFCVFKFAYLFFMIFFFYFKIKKKYCLFILLTFS